MEAAVVDIFAAAVDVLVACMLLTRFRCLYSVMSSLFPVPHKFTRLSRTSVLIFSCYK